MTAEQLDVMDAHRRLGVKIAHLIKRAHFYGDRYRITCGWCGINRAIRADDVWLVYEGSSQFSEGIMSCQDIIGSPT